MGLLLCALVARPNGHDPQSENSIGTCNVRRTVLNKKKTNYYLVTHYEYTVGQKCI